MQVRDGPAAVRGDARRGNATGRTGREGREGGAPSQKTCRAPRSRTPRGRRIRASQTQHSLGASRRRPDADRARGERQASGSKARPPRSSARRSRASRPTTRSRPSTWPARPESSTTARRRPTSATYVSQIGKYAAGRLGRLGVQGERRLAARRRRQGDAEGRRRRRSGTTRPSAPTGGPPTLELQRLPANCYVVADRQRRRQAGPRGDRDAHGRREAVQDEGGPRLHRQARRARPGDRARRGPLERREVIRRAVSAFAVLVLLAGCGGAAGEEEGTAQLWVTRDRGAKLLVDTKVEAGQTLMRALASEADVKTRYGGRYVQSVNGIEGSLSAAARLVLVRQRLRGRPQRRLVPAPRRRCRLARLPRLAAGRGGARRRRRVPGAVRARLRREDAAGRVRYERGSETAGAGSSARSSVRPRSCRSGRLCRRVRMCSRCEAVLRA